MSTSSDVAALYKQVIEDVIRNVRSDFVNMGVDEQVLFDLQAIWEQKLIATKVFHPNDFPLSTGGTGHVGGFFPTGMDAMAMAAVSSSYGVGVGGIPGVSGMMMGTPGSQIPLSQYYPSRPMVNMPRSTYVQPVPPTTSYPTHPPPPYIGTAPVFYPGAGSTLPPLVNAGYPGGASSHPQIRRTSVGPADAATATASSKEGGRLPNDPNATTPHVTSSSFSRKPVPDEDDSARKQQNLRIPQVDGADSLLFNNFNQADAEISKILMRKQVELDVEFTPKVVNIPQYDGADQNDTPSLSSTSETQPNAEDEDGANDNSTNEGEEAQPEDKSSANTKTGHPNSHSTAAEIGNSAVAPSADELGSDLDDESEEDVEQGADIEDFILAQYVKVHRARNRWKCELKAGVVHIGKVDRVFNKATGDFEW